MPWLLLAGYALRLTVALSSDTFWRADEIFQYLEQAHRIAFGYGFVPWEYEAGVRTWLIAAVPLAVLKICDAFGFGHPDYYVPAVRALNATLSMLVPVGTYVLCKQLISERVARGALAIACLWYEFIPLAPHTQAELYATYLFFAAAMLLRKGLGPTRSVAIGGLLGLSIAVRFPYLMAVAPFGLILMLLPGTHASRLCLVGGGALGLFAWGLVDKLTWGGWWASIFQYVDIVSGEDRLGGLPAMHGVKLILYPSMGIMLAAAAWAAVRWRRLLPIAFPLWLALPFHWFIGFAGEYTNFALMIALAGIALADLCLASSRSLPASIRRSMPYAAAALLAAFSLAALGGQTWGHKHTEARRDAYLFVHDARLTAFSILAREPEHAVKRVMIDDLWLATDTGGYYYLHQDAALLFPWSRPEHLQGMVRNGQLVPADIATHAITRFPECFPGFRAIGRAGPWALLRNDSPDLVRSSEPADRKIGLPNPQIGAILGTQNEIMVAWHGSCSGS